VDKTLTWLGGEMLSIVKNLMGGFGVWSHGLGFGRMLKTLMGFVKTNGWQGFGVG
jgi:hypothetical protein